jgi:serine/threonine-protein kinase PRP4
MLDNWDDIEGYYKVILGELLNARYHVQANLGKGMFSSVVRAMDVTTKKLVAIKLIRNNETM